MDAVSAMLGGHRARGAFLLRCVMAPPWGVRIDDRAAVSVLVGVRGGLWLVRESQQAVRIDPGDVAVVKGTAPYLLADEPSTRPTAVIEPGQICRTLDGEELAASFRRGLRTWGNADDGPCAFLTGTYELAGQVTGRLLEAIPDLVVVRSGDWDAPAVRLLTEEFGRDAAGQDAVLDRLVDLVLISALREWFARNPDRVPAWWRAQQDPLIGAVLRLMHDRLDQPWTLSSLADQVAVSRATLARRFAELVGQPPMAYLTDWRLATAADRLRESQDSVESIGRRVGYANPFAFSTAFKRRFGVGPRLFRIAGPVPPEPT
jgi:AraC-like DNA-binding protein